MAPHTLCHMDQLQIIKPSCVYGVLVVECTQTRLPHIAKEIRQQYNFWSVQSMKELHRLGLLTLEGGAIFQLDDSLGQPDIPPFHLLLLKGGTGCFFYTPLKLEKPRILSGGT
ncbi:hypothetical protein DPEC_G00077710 [Dallia pectoralis]|uniref:Uncharacterized protein n=1 Tax=Dallia pectoralis TaxID=75939 RepID=A0ACC2H498_DALPE|nr:hypothetical protein DPEC_G00077710 [Dallia pectoralis]